MAHAARKFMADWFKTTRGALLECGACRGAREERARAKYTERNTLLLAALKRLYVDHNIIALNNRLVFWPVKLPLEFDELYHVVHCDRGKMHAFSAATLVILFFLNVATEGRCTLPLQSAIHKEMAKHHIARQFPQTLCCSWLLDRLVPVVTLPGTDVCSGLQFCPRQGAPPADAALEDLYQNCGIVTLRNFYVPIPACLRFRLPRTLSDALQLKRCQSGEFVDKVPSFIIDAYRHADASMSRAFAAGQGGGDKAALAVFESCCSFLASFGFAYCKINVIPDEDSTQPGKRRRYSGEAKAANSITSPTKDGAFLAENFSADDWTFPDTLFDEGKLTF